MQKPNAHSPSAPAIALATLAVLAPALGGATQLWAQAVLLLAFATLLMVAPPRQSPGAIWLILFFAIAGLGLTAFLPVQWFGAPAWRQMLSANHEVNLPHTHSPQPWLSAEAFGLLFSGLVFALYLRAQHWEPTARHRALQWYAAGIVILAAAALASHFFHYKVPFWPKTLNSPVNFGFFPNRNQTANVLALAGIVSTALAFEAFQRRERTGGFWLVAVVVIGAALVINYSRAGIALFVGGISAWVLFAFALKTSRKALALGLSGVAVLLALFLLFGGETLQRFQAQAWIAPTDFRISVHEDAWRLAASAPWFGQGLGNFEPVFAMARNASAAQNRALHPESDWLWTAVELGWPATLLLLGAGALWLKSCFPFSQRSDRYLPSAAAFCGIAFMLHGIVDVSGHRPGAVWPALFVASLGMHRDRASNPQPWVAPIFRLLGVVIGMIGVWWLTSVCSERIDRITPTTQTLARLTEKLERETAQGAFPEALQTAGEALRIAPLDWGLYYQRGVARLATSPLLWVAARDFQTARRLEPHWPDLCFREGQLWLSVNQFEYVMDAWPEALQRAGKDAPNLYAQMLAAARTRFTLHLALQEIAQSSIDYLLVFLQYADRLECELEIARLIEANPTLQGLSPTQRRMLFFAWFQRGDRLLLNSKFLENPDWLAAGWPFLAMSYAEDKDFARAYEITRQFGTAPTLPRLAPTKSLATLEQQFRFHPNNIQEGLELFTAQRNAGKTEEAIATLVALQAIPRHPAYLSYIEATLHAERERWEAAWKALRRFADADFH